MLYYLCDPMSTAGTNDRALFTPRQDQLNNQKMEDLTEARTMSSPSASVYREE